MSTSSNKQFWWGTAWGVASTLSAVWVAQRFSKALLLKNQKTTIASTSTSTTTTTTTKDGKESYSLLDTPDLEQRMIRKAEAVLQWRTSRITVVVERCTNDHNYSAILRTAEALGVQHIWIIEPPPPPTLLETENGEVTTTNSRALKSRQPQQSVTKEELKKRALHHLFAQRANEWLTVREFENTAACLEELKKTQHDIWVTDLSQEAVCMTPEGLSLSLSNDNNNNNNNNTYTLPPQLAIVFGTEAVGCSDEMLQAADKRVYLPLRGFADSLNLSVATALCLQQLFVLDPSVIGSMPEDERCTLRKAWYTQLCRQRLLTPKQKKYRTRLQADLRQCKKIQAKKDSGQKLERDQAAKLKNVKQIQKELKALEEEATIDGNSEISQAIQHLVDNPPEPLTDLRRADTHRDYFLKNTKQKQKDDSTNNSMAATSHSDTSTEGQKGNSRFFRDLMQQTSKR